MNPEADPLAALRDIHLPAEPSWWPPAPGWWIIGLLVIAIATFILRVVLIQWKRRLPSRELVIRLRQINSGERPLDNYNSLVEISGLVRRYVVTRYGRSQTAGLTGERWLQFLDRISGSSDFTQGPGKCLADGPYRGQSDFEIDALITSIENLAKHSPDRNTPY